MQLLGEAPEVGAGGPPGQDPIAWFPNNVARNSPASISDFEIVSLGLQRLWRMLKVQAIELRATFLALRIVGCGGGVRSVPGIVDSVVGRRPNTGVRLGRLINQNSHVIWVP